MGRVFMLTEVKSWMLNRKRPGVVGCSGIRCQRELNWELIRGACLFSDWGWVGAKALNQDGHIGEKIKKGRSLWEGVGAGDIRLRHLVNTGT